MLGSTLPRLCGTAGIPPLLSVLQDISAQKKTLSFLELAQRPQVPPRSLPFMPPPRWASELSRQLRRTFPELEQVHYTRYLQSFIHPTFTTADGASSTMQPLVPLGDAVLARSVSNWVCSTFDDLKRDEMHSLISMLASDTSLSTVLRRHWELESMVLTDASTDLFSKEKVRSTKGLAQWLSSNGMQSIPDPYAASCVKAVIGVVLLEGGVAASDAFCERHVLPYLG